MNFKEAILKRRSVRTFDFKNDLTPELLADINNFLKNMTPCKRLFKFLKEYMIVKFYANKSQNHHCPMRLSQFWH